MEEMVVEYLCPGCDTQLTFGSERCPGCGAIVEWLEAREADAGTPVTVPADAAGPGLEVAAEVPSPAPAVMDEPVPSSPEVTAVEETTDPRPVPVEAPAAAPAGDALSTDGLRTVTRGTARGERYYLGVLSIRGVVAMAVMLAAFGGTVTAARWDTWVGGAEAETLGTMQLTAVSLGMATILVAGSVGVWDAFASSMEAARGPAGRAGGTQR